MRGRNQISSRFYSNKIGDERCSLKEPSLPLADGHSQILRSSALVKGTNSPTCFVHPNARVHRST